MSIVFSEYVSIVFSEYMSIVYGEEPQLAEA